MRSKRSLPKHKANNHHKELCKIKGHYSGVHTANFFRCYDPTKAKNTANGDTFQRKRVHIVDSGASLHMMGLSFLKHRERRLINKQAKFWMFRPPMAWWCRPRKQRSTSRSLALVSGDIWWNFLRPCCHWEDNAMNLFNLTRGRQEKFPDYQEGQKVIECSIENVVPFKAVTKLRAASSIEFSSTKGNFERETEVEDAIFDLWNPFTEGLEEYDVSSSTPKLVVTLCIC